MQVDGSSVLLAALGSFWVVCGFRYFPAIERGDVAGVAKLHQDLAPTASRGAWRYKNLALGVIGAGWILTAALRVLRPETSSGWLVASAAAILLEQLSMPALSPRHWKSWSGVFIGVVLAGSLMGLNGVNLPL